MTEEFVLDGVDGDGRAESPIPIERIIALATSLVTPDLTEELEAVHDPGAYAVAGDVDPRSIAEAGWGLVFPAVKSSDAEGKKRRAALEEALEPLITYRMEQAGARFRKLEWRPGETREQFLGRYNQPIGPIDPDLVPYYQLIVASPTEITFDQQYSLDVPAATGRVWFDKLDDLNRYATFVRDIEKGTRPYQRPRTMSFLAVQNAGDDATDKSSKLLVPKLADVKVDGWTVDTKIGSDATRAELLARCGGKATPALLFTASHGERRDKTDVDQRALQGALIWQEWQGGRPKREHLFAAEDIKDDADVAGMIAFLFACHGAGTPVDNQFLDASAQVPPKLAEEAFLAALPMRLLSHPNGPALGVIGHVERAWVTGFMFENVPQLVHYLAMLRGIAKGQRLGHALENFGQRFSDLATILTRELKNLEYATPTEKDKLTRYIARLWIAAHDARNYILLGDPAAAIPSLPV